MFTIPAMASLKHNAAQCVSHQQRVDRGSGQDLVNDLAVDVGQPAVDAVVAERQPLVVDAEQVQDRGVEVVAVGRVLGGLVRPFVAGAVGRCRP